MLLYMNMLRNENDRKLFDELYGLYHKRMIAIAYSITHNKCEAEDVVHDTYLTIIDYIEKFTDSDSKKCYNLIVTIVKNKCYNKFKRNKVKQRVEEETCIDEDDISNDSLSIVVSNEGYKNLIECIHSLDRNHTEILILKYVHNFDDGQIAKLLGISMQVVYTRKHRAKQALMKALQEKDLTV